MELNQEIIPSMLNCAKTTNWSTYPYFEGRSAEIEFGNVISTTVGKNNDIKRIMWNNSIDSQRALQVL